ncbi:MAG: secretin N-terminal domain-containing protein [Pseudomonadota bacterium]
MTTDVKTRHAQALAVVLVTSCVIAPMVSAPASASEFSNLGLKGTSDIQASQTASQVVDEVSAPAVASPAKKADADIIVVNQDLRSLIQDFARNLGVQAQISSAVRGKVQNRRLPSEPEGFLKALADEFTLGWFFDGPVLHVSSASEYATRLISLDRFKYDTLIEQMETVGLTTKRFSLRELPEANALLVTAPPQYVARVEVILEALKARQSSGDGIRVIRFGRTSRVEGS